MNARSVSERAWRKPGMTMAILLGLISLPQARAGQVDITVTGTVAGGMDMYGIFFHGEEAKSLDGKPFKVVFTFDDQKGTVEKTSCVTGRHGIGGDSPGTAVLTIAGHSFPFGGTDEFQSGIARTCEGTLLAVFVTRKVTGMFGMSLGINVRIFPRAGRLPTGSDWRSAMSASDVTTQNSGFMISNGTSTSPVTSGGFKVDRVEISAGKAGR